MARLAELFRSFALRTALAASAVVLAVTAAGLAFGYWRSETVLHQSLEIAIRSEAEKLLIVWRLRGATGLAAEVARHGELVPGSAMVATLQTLDGRYISGARLNLPAPLQGADTLEDRAAGQLRALGIIVPGGLNLVVAAQMRAVLDTASTLLQSLLLAGAAALVIAPLFGVWMAWRTERRLRAISGAASAIMAGDLSRRLPVGRSADEFDRLGTTINAMLARIEQLMAGLRQVTDDIAHDLRSPLARLRQRLELAQTQPRETAADAKTFAASIDELDTVLDTFAALLRIAQLEARAERPVARVNLSTLVRDMADIYTAMAEDVGKTLHVAIAPDVWIAGDVALLRQMLANLIENALHHGGGNIRVTLEPPGTLRVADDGPGIPEEDRARVLKRFVRLDRSRGTPGSGLGLALIAAIARLHGAEPVLSDAAPGLCITLQFEEMSALANPAA